ncbi:MAG: hypothetical protein ACKVG7_08180 [Flavobacteriales bacterium]
MKKLLFVLAFTFIGQQAFSQIYIVTIGGWEIGGCNQYNPNAEYTLTKVSPSGVQTHTCIPRSVTEGALISLSQELNSITSQGYKLIETSYSEGSSSGGGLMIGLGVNDEAAFIFAIP